MQIYNTVIKKINENAFAKQIREDRRYRVIIVAVLALIFNLIFAFYNLILGILSSSLIFAVSAGYYLLLCSMRFSAVAVETHQKGNYHHGISVLIGILLIFLSLIFQWMVLIGIKHRNAAVYGTIPMISIATFTFTKIIFAVISAVKTKKDPADAIKAINRIRYCEVAVSLFTMQQSMLASFGGENEYYAMVLNACTGAAVCFFILVMGIFTLKK